MIIKSNIFYKLRVFRFLTLFFSLINLCFASNPTETIMEPSIEVRKIANTINSMNPSNFKRLLRQIPEETLYQLFRDFLPDSVKSKNITVDVDETIQVNLLRNHQDSLAIKFILDKNPSTYSEDKINSTVVLNQSFIPKIQGHVMAYFKTSSPLYGSGTLIDNHHVIILASLILLFKEPAERVVFLLDNGKAYDVAVMSTSHRFLEEVDETESQHNYCILTLKLPIDSLSSLSVPFLPANINLDEKLDYFLGNSRGPIEHATPSSTTESSNNSFIFYKNLSQPGDGGVALWAKDPQDCCYLAGINLGRARDDASLEKAFKITSDLQSKINFMKQVNTVLRQSLACKNPEAVMDALINIPLVNRHNILEGTSYFMDLSSGFDRAPVIRALANGSAQKIRHLLELVAPVLNNLSNGFKRASVIRNVTVIQTAEKN